MKEEQITFDTAVLAKEKGFDIKTDEYFSSDTKVTSVSYNEYAAPSQSLLQRWLREEHDIHVCVESGYDISLGYNRGYGLRVNGVREFHNGDVFEVYEIALEAGLKEALTLIN